MIKPCIVPLCPGCPKLFSWGSALFPGKYSSSFRSGVKASYCLLGLRGTRARPPWLWDWEPVLWMAIEKPLWERASLMLHMKQALYKTIVMFRKVGPFLDWEQIKDVLDLCQSVSGLLVVHWQRFPLHSFLDNPAIWGRAWKHNFYFRSLDFFKKGTILAGLCTVLLCTPRIYTKYFPMNLLLLFQFLISWSTRRKNLFLSGKDWPKRTERETRNGNILWIRRTLGFSCSLNEFLK